MGTAVNGRRGGQGGQHAGKDGTPALAAARTAARGLTRAPSATPSSPATKTPVMTLHSTIDPSSSDFARNADAMRALVADLRSKLTQVSEGGGEASRKRH